MERTKKTGLLSVGLFRGLLFMLVAIAVLAAEKPSVPIQEKRP